MASAADTRTVTLLLTDVVDSTALTRELGDVRMAQVWATHDRLARDLLEPHGGREIDKSDGFLLLFEHAADALRYAEAYHAAIGSLDPPLAARAGAHTADVQLVETPPEDVSRGAKPLEVQGVAKAVAARIMSIAPGGQTLATQEAVQAAGEGVQTQSHGHWMLKGLAEPIAVHEVRVNGAPASPPLDDVEKAWQVVRHGDQWRPLREVPHRLPAERDTFVGRHGDLSELAALLDGGARLVSVLGIGGCGKTRLVTRFAWSRRTTYPGGAWFCDLSEARTADGILAAVALGLEVALSAGDAAAQLGRAIGSRGKCLIVLDNFEQVARHADETLGRWLDLAADATFVVTTREVLGLTGECSFSLPPLTPESARELFVARASSARRGFTVSAEDAPVIAELVALLDRLPLAIELAAARVRMMPPAMILARMNERFRLLTSERRDRQATLRATLDWSWDLLAPQEQLALAQLSTFEGGFRLDAAEAVLEVGDAWPVDLIGALVDKSLVRPISDDRYDMLVSVQTYAAEKLDDGGATWARHGAYLARYGADSEPPPEELDNLVAACRRAIQRTDVDVAVRTLRATWMILQYVGPDRPVLKLAEEAVALTEPGTLGWARAQAIVGQVKFARGHLGEARPHLEAALQAFEAAGDRWGVLDVQVGLGAIDMRAGDVERGRELTSATAREARALGLKDFEVYAVTNLTLLAFGAPEEEGVASVKDALRVVRELGDRRHEGMILTNLGAVLFQHGRLDEARDVYADALVVHRGIGNRRSEGNVLTNLAEIAEAVDADEEARAYLRDALRLHREVGNQRSEAVTLAIMGRCDLNRGRFDDAESALVSALAAFQELGGHPLEQDVQALLAETLLEQPERTRMPRSSRGT